MKIKEMVEQTLKSGIIPVRLRYDKTDVFKSERSFIRSFIIIESLDIGTLTPKEYRFVARRTKQGDYLVKRHIEKLFREYPILIENSPKTECFTIPVYARLLKEGKLAGILFEAFALFPDVEPNKICIELSADILYEDIEESKKRINELKDMGIRIAICEVGDEFCPVFRLSEINFDYAFVDDFATASLGTESADRVAGSLVKFLHFLNVTVIAPDLDSDIKVADAERVGFDGYGFSEPIAVNDGTEVAVDE